MPKPTIVAKNPSGLQDLLNRIGDKLGESTLRQASVAGARVVLEEAKQRAPVGPLPHHQGSEKFPVGFGRDALLVAYLPENSIVGRVATYMVTWSADAYYLRFYEYGTSKMDAKPFFRPAIDATVRSQLDAIEGVLDKAMSEVRRGQ